MWRIVRCKLVSMKHDTYERTLKSGARLVVINVPGSPIFELETVVNSGYRFSDPVTFELPHLLEHLAFEGSKNYPDPQTFNFETERYGIYHNAWTGQYRNGYVFYGAMEYWDHIVGLGMEQLLHPSFRQASIDEQKEVVKNELTGKMNNANARCGYLMYQLSTNGLIPDYPERILSLKKITRQHILDYYKRLYYPKNFVHLVTGDLPTERVDELALAIEAAQSHLKQGEAIENQPILPDTPEKVVYQLEHPFEESANFSFKIFQTGFDEERYPAMHILSMMLNGGWYSRLHQKARRAGLSYSIGSNFGTDHDESSLAVYDQTQAQHVLPLVKLFLDEIEDLARGNFTDTELDRAKGYVIGRHAVRFQTASSITNWYADAQARVYPRRSASSDPRSDCESGQTLFLEGQQEPLFDRGQPAR